MLQFVMTGKFQAPNSNWKHNRLPLNEYELFLMTEGILYLTYNEKQYCLHAGEYLLLPPTTSFREGFEESYCEFYWLHFSSEDTLDDSTILSIPTTGKVPKPDKMAVLLKQLQDTKKNLYPMLTLSALTTAIMTELYGQLQLRNRQNPIGNLSDEIKKQIYYDILDYIDTHVERNLKVSEIAEHFGYNEKYLSHRFRELSGRTIKEYILQAKVNRANYYLTDTNMSITSIALCLSFSDSHNFCRTYKRVTGLTPTEFRDTYPKRLLYHI